MTTPTEPTTTDIAAAEKTHAFLGLYFPLELKQKVKEAASMERRSMSQYMVMIVERHFAAAA